MPQRDVLAELRAARVPAPVEVRERVLAIAAAAPRERKRFTWRRALVFALPVAAAVAASVVFTRPSSHTAAPQAGRTLEPQVLRSATEHSPPDAIGVPSARQRVQLVGTSLELRTRDVSGAVKRAVRITTSFGGYATSVHAETHGRAATADLALKVPRTHVQQAMTRLAALGTIVSENVDVQDETAGLNAVDRQIARLQRRLAQLRAENAPARQIVVLTHRIEALQRGAAETRRAAHYATIQLHVETPQAAVAKPHHGPLHGAVVVLTWLGIGAVYAVAIGTPIVLALALAWLAARTLRRRREDALLSRP